MREPEIGVSQRSIGIRARTADVVVNPESDIAAEVARCKDAEQAGLKVCRWDVSAHCSRRELRVEVVRVPAGCLEELVVAQPYPRNPKDGFRPDVMAAILSLPLRSH